jgi:hypothetical protein
MVQDIDKHDRIKAVVLVRKALTVKGLDRNPGSRPDQDVDSLERQIRPLLHEKPGNKAVTATYVQNGSILGKHVSEVGTEHLDPAPGDKVLMDKIGKSHFLLIPIILTIKLEKIF